MKHERPPHEVAKERWRQFGRTATWAFIAAQRNDRRLIRIMK